MAEEVSLAILDDYANVAPKHFHRVSNLRITQIRETLDSNTSSGLEAQIERLQPYTVISTMRERTAFPADLVNNLPNLKLVLSSGLRNASLDLEAFKARGIPVTGTKGEATSTSREEEFEAPPPKGYSAVNQHAWALLLALCGRIPQDDRAVKTSSSTWQSGVGISLGGKTLGLVGLGKLGTLMGEVAVKAFQMKVIAWSQNLTQEKADEAAEGVGLPKGSFVAVGKQEVFSRADVVSVHLVLSARTKGIVGNQELSWMKKSGLLVNTSRGGLIDEQALIEALREGKIRGVALDVYWVEPLPADSLWRNVDEWAKSEVVLSPHMGYVNEWTMNRWYQEQAEHLEDWMKGRDLPVRMV